MAREFQQSTTPIYKFFLADASGDGVGGLTSITLTYGKGDAASGAATAVTNTITESSPPGWYKVTLTATETNTLGDLSFVANHATADKAWNDTVQIVDKVTVSDIEQAVIDACSSASLLLNQLFVAPATTLGAGSYGSDLLEDDPGLTGTYRFKANALDPVITALLATVMENSETLEDQIRLIRANAAGDVVVSNGGLTNALRDAADTKDRIVATVDSDGNRDVTAVDGT